MKLVSLKLLLLCILVIFNFQFSMAQLYVDGTSVLVQKNGVLYIDADFKTVKSGSVDPKVANWGKIGVTGNTQFHTSTIYNGVGEVEMSGTSKQTITSNSIPLKKLKIDNSGNVELSDDFTLDGDLTLTDGFLILGDNDLTLNDSVDISGGSSSSYIRINGTGKLKANVGATPRLLPVGRNPYLPIIIDDGGDNEFAVGISENVYANPESNSNQQTTNVVGETWTIQSSSAQSNVSVTLQWESSEEETGFARSSAHVAFWEHGVSSNWDVGTSASASGSGPYSLSRTVNFSTNLFYFGVGSAGSALPVDFTYFTAEWIASASLSNPNSEADTERSRSGSAVLNWQTAMEENNSHFEIQRSFDGLSFETVGQVQGQGSTFKTTNYQFIDNSSQFIDHRSQSTVKNEPSTIYYRLKQVDFDGQFEYSTTQTLSMETEMLQLMVFPNPAYGNVINTNDMGNYQIFSSEGRIVESAENTSVIYIGELDKGSYIIRNEKGESAMFIRN